MKKRWLPITVSSCLGMTLGVFLTLGALPCLAAESASAKNQVMHGASIPYDTGGVPAAEKRGPGEGDMPTAMHGVIGQENKEGDVGFPQLNAKTYPSQLFWLFVSFLTLYALMSRIALPGVEAVLTTRQAHRDGDLRRAAQLQEEAAKVKTAYEASLAKAQSDAQDALNGAEQDIAEKIAAENAKFTENARKTVATAERNIARAREEALASLADISADIAAEMVNKVAQIQVGKPEARKAVAAAMQKEAA